MSIIIKGMDKPKDCSYCILANKHINGLCEAKYYCRLEADFEHCPLVEIPTPHGRLIDADQITLECQWCSLDDAPTILEAEKESITFYDKPIGEAKEMPTTTSAESQ